MKTRMGLSSAAALLAAAGTALAAPRNYRGSDSLGPFLQALVQQCGGLEAGTKYPGLASGEFVFVGGGSSGGGFSMASGTQDLAPMTRTLLPSVRPTLPAAASEACDSSIAAGPLGEDLVSYTAPGSGATAVGADAEQWVVALDGIAIGTRAESALRCNADTPDDPHFPGSAALAFGPTKEFGVRANGATSGPILFTYSFQNWRDVLRILWAGADSTRAAVDGGGSNQLANNRIARCNSDVRRSLVNDWDNIIQGAGDCGTVAFSCQNTPNIGTGGLRHILRADDLAGSTDVFLTLLGLNSVGGSLPTGNLGLNEPFCNGRDHQDNDPIRIACTTKFTTPVSGSATNGGPSALNANLNDEICSASSVLGDNVVTVSHTQSGANPLYTILGPNQAGLGLVSAISVPTLISTNGGIPGTNNPAGTAGNRRAPTLDELYPTMNCLQGTFEFRGPPRQNVFVAASNGTALQPNASICPDGAALLGGLCLTPVFKAGNAEGGSAHCINGKDNRSPGAVDPIPGGANNSDGRLWNQFIRAAPGSGFTGAGQGPGVLRNERGRDAMYSTFRLRERRATLAAGTTPAFPYDPATQTCREMDSGRAIGCLSRVAECTLGYARADAASAAGATPLLVGNDSDPDPFIIGASVTGIGPSHDALRALRDGSPVDEHYQLGHRLYFNSIVGFSRLAPGGPRYPELDPDGHAETFELYQCLTNGAPDDEAAVLLAIAGAGLVPPIADDSGAVACQEFNESWCGPVANQLPDDDPGLVSSCPPP